jgi:pimeloyl-ACP methyl ester carboxylesterase
LPHNIALKSITPCTSLSTAPSAYCYTGGKAFDVAKPTVVFIHGVLNDHSVWILAKPLPGQPRLQRAGSGPAGTLPQRRRGPSSVEEAADFIAALLDTP